MNLAKNIMLEEDVACSLCCIKNDEVVLAGCDLLHNLPGEFKVVKCKCCGLMRTNPRPTPESIGGFYPDNYGPYLGTQVHPAKEKRNSHVKNLLKSLASLLNFNTQCLPPLAPTRMLEVGCASGAFLHTMACRGWQVQGIEFSKKAAEAASQLGYQVHAGSLETAPTPEEPFDLIVGWMVLEHLHDPILGLKKLREWAKPNSWLVLSVPNAGSLEFRFFKEKWYALQLPTHLHHFTPETLEKVLDASGWKLQKVHHQRVLSNLIASAGYLLHSKGFIKLGQKFIDFPERARWHHYALYPIAWMLSLFGQTGRMTIWAQVKS